MGGMKRAGSLLTLLALGIGAAAANATTAASGPSIRLQAPKSLSGSTRYDVRASGHAQRHGGTYVGVLVWRVPSCPNNYFAAINEPHNFVYEFNGGSGIGIRVVGAYNVHTKSGFWGGPPERALICGYVYGSHQSQASPAKARATRKIHFTS